MPTFELEDSEFAGYIEDDTIKAATVAGIKMVTKQYKDDDGNDVKKVEFKFVITDDSPHADQPIWGETSTNFNSHPNCKLRNWAQAILGGTELPVGYRLDTDVLVGNDCRIVVGLREYEKDGQTKQHNFVKDIIPSSDAMDRLASSTQYDEEEPF